MAEEETLTDQLTGILSKTDEPDTEVVLSVHKKDGSHRQYYLQGKERVITEPEETPAKPTAEDLTAEIKHLQEVFLAVYQSRIDGMIENKGYGPRMAECFRDACSEGFLHSLHYHHRPEYMAEYALGYGEGFVKGYTGTLYDCLRDETLDLDWSRFDSDILTEVETWYRQQGR